MKVIPQLFVSIGICLSFVVLNADVVPFAEPWHEGLNVKEFAKLMDIKLGLWLQYRVMYDRSDIPGPPGTSLSNTTGYDFFRQRMRIGIDARTKDSVGGYIQLEYRGGWGGSSPAMSDPREMSPVVNPFNRLQARGLRYAFLYADMQEMANLSAGILPVTDRVGRVLFDADWDFNVGGLQLWGSGPSNDYRIAYVVLVEGVGGTGLQGGDKDEALLVLDYSPTSIQTIRLGFHLYHLLIPDNSSGGLGINTGDQTWFGVTAQKIIDPIDIRGKLILNQGEMSGGSHTGTALGLEMGISEGPKRLDILFVSTTGDPDGEIDRRFVTLHELLGTHGFWGYTHIFTANGPSDVNDLGVEIGNGGAGLMTIQARGILPISNRVEIHLAGGIFRSNKPRHESKEMGQEISTMLATWLSDYFVWDVGLAVAFLGDFYQEIQYSDATGDVSYYANPENLTEVFSRLQFTW